MAYLLIYVDYAAPKHFKVDPLALRRTLNFLDILHYHNEAILINKVSGFFLSFV